MTLEQHKFVEEEAKKQKLSINQFLVKLIDNYKNENYSTSGMSKELKAIHDMLSDLMSRVERKEDNNKK